MVPNSVFALLGSTVVQMTTETNKIGDNKMEDIKNGTCRNQSCGANIVPDEVNGWVHADTGLAGCGGPDAESRELYAEPVCTPCAGGEHADDGTGQDCPCCGQYVSEVV